MEPRGGRHWRPRARHGLQWAVEKPHAPRLTQAAFGVKRGAEEVSKSEIRKKGTRLRVIRSQFILRPVLLP